MTDYKEEQANEIEALESIYPDELQILTTEPFYSFQIPVKIDYDNEGEQDEASVTLQFCYTAKYPDEAPEMSIEEYEGLEDDMIDQLMESMKEQAAENLGMVMVFTIVSAVQDKMLELSEAAAIRRQQEKEEKIKQAEEAERKKFEGTRVSIETFLAWKAKFDAEIAELKRQKGLRDPNENKPTGKELFMTDATLDDSDVKFLEEEGDSVAVDESLFQDLDDLDIEEDLDDS